MPLSSVNAASTASNAVASAPPHRDVTSMLPSPSAPPPPSPPPSPGLAAPPPPPSPSPSPSPPARGSMALGGLDERLLALGIEDVQLVERDGEVDLVADAHLLLGWQEGNDLGALGLCVDQLLVAQVLHHVNTRRDAHRLSLTVGNLDVLRSEADEQVGALGALASDL